MIYISVLKKQETHNSGDLQFSNPYKKQDSQNFCVSLSDQWAMNMAAIYIDDLVDALYKAGQAIRPINIEIRNPRSVYVHNLNALLKEISEFLLPALAQPGVNPTTIFASNQPIDWIDGLQERRLQLEHAARDAYPAGSHVALLEVAIVRVIETLEDTATFANTVPALEGSESDSGDSQETLQSCFCSAMPCSLCSSMS